jgi:hypothetical protein
MRSGGPVTLMDANTAPDAFLIGAATQRTFAWCSQSSIEKPLARVLARSDLSASPVAMVDGVKGFRPAATTRSMVASSWNARIALPTPALQFLAVDEHGQLAVEDAEVHRLAAELRQAVRQWLRHPVQIEIGQVEAPEFEQLETKPIAVAVAVLLDEAEFLQRAQQPMRRCLWKSRTGLKRRERERAVARRETGQQPPDLPHRVDDVLAPFAHWTPSVPPCETSWDRTAIARGLYCT